MRSNALSFAMGLLVGMGAGFELGSHLVLGVVTLLGVTITAIYLVIRLMGTRPEKTTPK